MTSPDPAPYRVLARKYRPQTFDDLIGQEPMVTTLSNAFSTGRIPQAWMLTGVRGVGKTTTARILARALNYAVDGGADQPTIQMPAPGLHCEAIMEGRHVDVIEMDAASHNGVADIREITDAARYKPVSARFKVYILDEVHMLSSAAFNALLKTLEEPPGHVKFVFATTEIRKVPVTVLSRCQRFDLRRIPADTLISHLSRVADLEAVAAEEEALRMISRAAEGSVRDSLSLLDQAIARGAGAVTAADVKEMLGLADRARVIDLFEHVLRGDAAAAVTELDAQYDVGGDPVVVLTDLANFCHLVTRMKIVPGDASDATVTEEERTRGAAFAEALGIASLSRTWQALLKGIEEAQEAARPLAAAEMLLVRLAHMASLPTPEDALKALTEEAASAQGGSGQGQAPGVRQGAGPAATTTDGPDATVAALGTSSTPRPSVAGTGGDSGAARARAPIEDGFELPQDAEPAVAAAPSQADDGPSLRSLADVAALAGERRAVDLKHAVETQMRPVRFEPGRIEVELTPGAAPNLAGRLGTRLSEWTGARWIVTIVASGGGATLDEAARAEAAGRERDAREHPLVRAVLDRFPGSKIVDVRINEPAAPEPELDVPADDEQTALDD